MIKAINPISFKANKIETNSNENLERREDQALSA